MKYQLILLNSTHEQDPLQQTSSFVNMPKHQFEAMAKQATFVLSVPQLIVMQADSDCLQEDLALLSFLKESPVFKDTPVVVFTLGHIVNEGKYYFEKGASTCMLLTGMPNNWASVIDHIPAYSVEAA
jgi:hypothetical protein